MFAKLRNWLPVQWVTFVVLNTWSPENAAKYKLGLKIAGYVIGLHENKAVYFPSRTIISVKTLEERPLNGLPLEL